MPVSESNNPIVAETTNIGSELAAESTSDPVSPTVTETEVDTAVVAVPGPPSERKKVDFTTDIASKALIESIAPIMEDFKIENLIEVLPEIISQVQSSGTSQIHSLCRYSQRLC